MNEGPAPTPKASHSNNGGSEMKSLSGNDDLESNKSVGSIKSIGSNKSKS
jgi:hypothetical protein